MRYLWGGYDAYENGWRDVDGVTIDSCDALTYHGFLGIENEAVEKITKHFDKIFKKITK